MARKNEEKARTTMHKGRAHEEKVRGVKTYKVFNPKHPDRNGINKAENIDPALSYRNQYWNYYDGEYSGDAKEGKMTFEDAEKKFYETHFGAGLERINKGYIKNRHKEKVRTMDEYRMGGTQARTAPEDTLWYIGDNDHNVDPEMLRKLVVKEIEWEQQAFPQVVVLNFALHLDEPESAPHIEMRSVWVGHDEDGNEVASMASAQREMGIERPDPTKPQTRYNNPKQTYTALCLTHFQQLCIEAGLDIELVPRDPMESGRPIADFKKKKAEERLKEIEYELATKTAENDRLTAENEAKNEEIARKDKELNDLKTKLDKYINRDIDISGKEIEAAPVFGTGGKYSKVRTEELEMIQEEAKAYRANKDKIDNLKQIEKTTIRREQDVAEREKKVTEREKNASIQTLQSKNEAQEREILSLTEQISDKDKIITEMEKSAQTAENLLVALAGVANTLSDDQRPVVRAAVRYIEAVIHTNVPDQEDSIYDDVGLPVYINRWLEAHDLYPITK